MVGEHFDHLARVTATGSRRDYLRAFVGALLAGVVARTHASATQLEGTEAASGGKEPAALPLGSPCEVNAQCAIDHADAGEIFFDRDPAPICGDNGIDKDGFGNCCKPAGEYAFCRRDADCCDDGVCVGIKQLGTVCSRTDQLDLGMSCTRTAECYGQTRGFNMLCDSNGAGQRVCCVNGGGWLACHDDGHCCGTALCVKEPGEERGLCLDPNDGGQPLGAACNQGEHPCSQTGGITICADNGDWYDFETNCCRTDGELCRQDHDCCAGFICLDGACGPGGGTDKQWGDIGGAQPSESGPVPSLADLLPRELPLEHTRCFWVENDRVLTFDELATNLAGTDEARDRLQSWGWQASTNRTFACDTPPEGEAGWVDISVHLFADAASAQEAVDYFASVRGEGTGLVSAAPPAIGDHAAVLSGPATNGKEFTLYVSQGPLLIRVTGISRTGIPFSNVMTVTQPMVAASYDAP